MSKSNPPGCRLTNFTRLPRTRPPCLGPSPSHLLVISALLYDAADLLVAQLHVRVFPIHVLSRPLEQLLVARGHQVSVALAVQCSHTCFFPLSFRRVPGGSLTTRLYPGRRTAQSGGASTRLALFEPEGHTPYEGAFASRQAIPSASAATASATSRTGSRRNRKTAKLVAVFYTSARSSVSRTAYPPNSPTRTRN